MKKRWIQMDVTRGVGILIIVFGHSWFVASSPTVLYPLLSPFILPLFFFISGVFFRTEQPFGEMALRKADALLKPFFVTMLGYVILRDLLRGQPLLPDIGGVLYASVDTLPWQALWYLPHFWVATLFAWFMLRVIQRLGLSLAASCVLLAVQLGLGILFLKTFWQIPVEFGGEQYLLPGLPFSLDITLISSAHFMFGYVLRDVLRRHQSSLLTLCIALAVTTASFLYYPTVVDMAQRRYDHWFWATVQAVSGVYLCWALSGLLKKHGVDVVQGWARILDGKSVAVELAGGGSQRIECEHLLLAAGSQSVELPILPLGGKVISSTEALAPGSLPKRLVVVGGGYIGLELGTAYRKLGVEVAVVEAQPRILPGYDEELTKPVAQALRKLGVELYLGHSLLGPSENGVRVRDGAGEEREIAADQVLVAVGRKPRSEGWNLESLGLDMNGRAVKVDDQCRTSMRNVWAIGDLAGEPMLAHRAMAQGEMVAELIAGKRRQFAPVAIPAVCFTDPEVVVAGLSPEQAKDAGLDCLVASFPFAANGRAMTLEANEGFVRVVARRDNHLVVGWQAVGKAVSELSTAFAQSLEMGARLEDIAGTIHAHPTLGEAVQEAALRALGHALHI